MTKRLKSIPILLILSTAVTVIAVNIYVPSLPQIADYFSTSGDNAQYSVAATLLGMVVSGLLYGPFSDVYGRRKLMLFGLMVFLLFTIGCIYATSITEFLVCRFLQGCGGGACQVLGLAITKDLFQGEKSTKILSQMWMVISMVPAFSPILGGHIAVYFGWQANFIVMGVWAILVFGALYKLLPETLEAPHRSILSMRGVFQDYFTLVSSPSYLIYASTHGALFCGKWCFMTVAPFVFIRVLGIAADDYGYYLAAVIAPYIGGLFMTQRIIHIYGNDRLLKAGLWTAIVGGVGLYSVSAWAPTSTGLICSAMGLYVIAMAFVVPTSTTKAMEVYGGMGGASSSILNGFRSFFSAIGASIGGFMEDVSFGHVSLFLIIMGLLPQILLHLLPKETDFKG